MRYLLSVGIVCLFVSVIHCQEYINSSTSWYTFRGDAHDSWYKKTKSTIDGDTIIHNETYKIVKNSIVDVLMMGPFSTDTVWVEERVGFEYVRLEGKKFYKWIGGAKELIVDFDMKIGDTILTRGGENDIVIGLDSVLIDNEYRKVFLTEEGNRIYEGIGSSNGVFLIEGYLGVEGVAFLKCYSHNGITYEMEPHPWSVIGAEMEDCENYLTTTKERDLDKIKIGIYPNPFTDKLFIESELSEMLEVELISMEGRVIYTAKIEGEKECLLSNIPKGIYIMKINSNNRVILRKLIKK